MAKSPYEILGVPESASADEIKKAYRKKARENHPDLHPDDPHAADRMNEINEAYDRLSNPDKYAEQDRRNRAAQGGGSPGSGGGYGGYAGGYPNGAGGTGGASQGYRTQGGSGPYGWTGDFGFGWEDFFDFGAATGGPVRPEASSQDSPDVRRAIDLINSNRHAEALKILNAVESGGRTARWHYLVALANDGAGNTMLAQDQIRKAVEMDPGNADYRRAYNNMKQTGARYQQQTVQQGFSVGFANPMLICCGCLMLQSFCCPIGFFI